jgi:acyl carrier protein
MRITKRKIIGLIAKETGVPPATISLTMDFVSTLQLNQHEEAIILLEIERKFHVFLPEERIFKLRTVSDLLHYLTGNSM